MSGHRFNNSASRDFHVEFKSHTVGGGHGAQHALLFLRQQPWQPPTPPRLPARTRGPAESSSSAVARTGAWSVPRSELHGDSAWVMHDLCFDTCRLTVRLCSNRSAARPHHRQGQEGPQGTTGCAEGFCRGNTSGTKQGHAGAAAGNIKPRLVLLSWTLQPSTSCKGCQSLKVDP